MRSIWKMVAAVLVVSGALMLPSPASATFEHQQKLTPSDTANALAGTSVALDGDLAVVGAPHGEGQSHAPDRGAVYVYSWDGNSWGRRAFLFPNSAAVGDAFGTSVAIDGTTIVVGANGVDLSPSTNEGVAYVFEQNDEGDWEQSAVLIAPDGTTGHAVGTSVAIDGNTVAVGANLANVGLKADQGAVYTFERSSGGAWLAADKLTASDGDVGDHLGTSVAIDGDTIVAGADFADGLLPTDSDHGVLYTFDRAGAASRTQTAKLVASDGATGDSLGTSVAIDGDTIVGGADFDKIGANTNQGGVYTFARTGSTSRAETAKLTASDGTAGDHLGASVAIDGDTIVAGATSLVVGSGNNPGAGYTFARTGAAARTQTAKLTADDAASGDHLGASAAISSGRILLGANTDDVGSGTNAGSAVAFDTPPPAGTFTAVTPFRLLDTRDGTGAPQAKVAAGQSVTFQVAGNGGVPSDGASAAVLNVTVTNAAAAGFITAYPSGTTRPLASNLNFAAGQTIPNHVTVKLTTGPSLDGDVTLYNGSPGTVDLVADVAGWYRGGVASEAGTFTAITPFRLLDTRNGTGAPQAKVTSTGRVEFDVEGKGGIPSIGVGAGALNITVTNPTASGFITAFPAGLPGAPPPLASNLNFSANQTIANAANVKVGQGIVGQVALYNGSPGTVDLIADAAGWFKSGTATVPGSYTPLTPARILDTRDGTGAPQAKVPAGGTINLTVAGHGGVPPTNTASSASAVVLNVTVTNPGAEGFITVYPGGATKPLASNLNFTAGKTIPNLVTVKLFTGGFGGVVRLYNGSSQPVDLIADVAGWYHR